MSDFPIILRSKTTLEATVAETRSLVARIEALNNSLRMPFSEQLAASSGVVEHDLNSCAQHTAKTGAGHERA